MVKHSGPQPTCTHEVANVECGIRQVNGVYGVVMKGHSDAKGCLSVSMSKFHVELSGLAYETVRG